MKSNENKTDLILELLHEQKLLQKEILNLSDASLFSGIAKSYMYKLTSRNVIPHYRPNGKLIYFKRIELEQWLTKNRINTVVEIDEQATQYLFNSKKNR